MSTTTPSQMHFMSLTSAWMTWISETANSHGGSPVAAQCAAAIVSASSMCSRSRVVQLSLLRSSCGPSKHTSMSPSGRYVRRGTEPNAVTRTSSPAKQPSTRLAMC